VLTRERHTGTLIFLASIRAILDYEPFKGIVAVDEAYIDFSEPSSGSSAVSLVAEYANICVPGRCVPLSSRISFLIIAVISRRLGIAIAQRPPIQILMNIVPRPSSQQKAFCYVRVAAGDFQFLMTSRSDRSGFQGDSC
jgi:hypothetical protein